MTFFCHPDCPTVQEWIDKEPEDRMKELDALRKLAEAADLNIDWIGAGPTRHGDLISTSGKPLFIDSVYLDCDEQDVDGDDYFVCSTGSDEYGQFIAAASPRVVLGLLDDLKAAEQQRDELLAGKLVEEPLRRKIAELQEARAACGERLIEVLQERDELRDEVEYHRTDAKKWANALDRANAELAKAAIQISDLCEEKEYAVRMSNMWRTDSEKLEALTIQLVKARQQNNQRDWVAAIDALCKYGEGAMEWNEGVAPKVGAGETALEVHGTVFFKDNHQYRSQLRFPVADGAYELVKIENPDMTHPLFHVAGESFEVIPDPLQKLGARLARLLDEDQFAECEALLLAAGVKPYNA